MESANNNFTPNLLEKDQTSSSSTFVRRKKRLILISFFLILLLALIITTGFLITIIIHNHTRESSDTLQFFISNRAVEAFCSVANNTPWCFFSFHSRVDRFHQIDPNYIYNLTVQISIKKISSLIDNSLNKTSNCSSSFVDSLSQLNGTWGIMQANPYVEMLSNDQRDGMMNKIIGAEENLKSCLDDLEKIKNSTAVDEVKERVHEVKLFVSSSIDFLRQYDKVFKKFRDDTEVKSNYGGFVVNSENMFDICMVGSQFLFVFFLFLSLFRTR